jgi:hypothetical protein
MRHAIRLDPEHVRDPLAQGALTLEQRMPIRQPDAVNGGHGQRRVTERDHLHAIDPFSGAVRRDREQIEAPGGEYDTYQQYQRIISENRISAPLSAFSTGITGLSKDAVIKPRAIMPNDTSGTTIKAME